MSDLKEEINYDKNDLRKKISKPTSSKFLQQKESMQETDSKNNDNNNTDDNNIENIIINIQPEEEIKVNFEENKNFQQIKEELNKASNFIDYFLVIGVEPSIFKNQWLYHNSFEELNQKEELKPKIISYFPPFEKQTIAFDDSIIMHCFPNGYQLIKSKKKPIYKLFSFILDNNYFNLNYPQKYLTCLIFYESILQYKELYYMNMQYEKILKGNTKNLLMKNSSNFSVDYNKGGEIYIPKCLMVMSLYPFFSEFERILLQIYNYSIGKIEIKTEIMRGIIDKNKDIDLQGNSNSEINVMRQTIKKDIKLINKGEKLGTKRSRSNNKKKDANEKQSSSKNKALQFRNSIKSIYDKMKQKINNANTLLNLVELNNNNNNNNISNNNNKDNNDCQTDVYGCDYLIDKFIENLLIELPVPPKGETRIIYSLMNEERELKQNKMNQLPIIDVNLKKLFIQFKVEEIIEIYRHLFLETRVLFFSKHIDILNVFIYGLLSLLYPFQYQYQIVTILPKENFEIIESITPFIAGINQSYEDNFFESRNLSLSDAILVLDLDKSKLQLINNESNTPDFPKSYKKQLDKNLNNILNHEKYINILEERDKRRNTTTTKPKKRSSCDYSSKIETGRISKNMQENSSKNLGNIISNNYIKSSSDNKPNNIPLKQNNIIDVEEVEAMLSEFSEFSNFNIDYDFNYEISTCFFNFNASLLANYGKFLNLSFYSSNQAPCLEVLFKVKEFLKDVPSTDKQFYDKFINETQLFGDFLYKRMIPKNSQEKIRVLLFDETINENHKTIFSKSHKVFIKSEEYEFVNKYEIQKPRELTDEEYSFLMKIKNKYNLLSYGIIVNEDKENDKYTFTYPVFPKLLTKIFFLNNIQEYYTNTGLSENIELINRDIIAKSHLGGITERHNDMKNYIDLCWLQMWAMTFWYCEEKEKKYRFNQLVNVLNKVSSHEMEILNLLFDTLEKNGEEYMILKLYDILLKLRLNPSFKVHNIVMKYLDKYKSAENVNINDILQKAIKHIPNNLESKDKYKKRTFKSKYYKNILSEEIIFYAFDTCIYCQKLINLQNRSRNFQEMNREIMWVKCRYCGQYTLTKIWIQFGKEINKNGKMKYNTSKYDSVVLFSPYSLKMNYKILLRDFGIKLDVEELMFKYSNIFWNSLWYFKLNKLEYDFMLPYEKVFDEGIFNDNIEVITNELYLREIKSKEYKKKKSEKINYDSDNKQTKIYNRFDDKMLKIERLQPIYPN